MIKRIRLIFSIALVSILIGCAALGSSVQYSNMAVSKPIQTDTIMLFPLQKVNWYNQFDPNYAIWAEKAISIFLVESGYVVIKSDSFREIRFIDQQIKGAEFEGRYFGLFPKMDFFSTKVDSAGAILGTTADLNFEVCLFSKNGQKIVHTKFNTYSGKLYFNLPRPSITVPDAAKGAIKKMVKEINSKNK